MTDELLKALQLIKEECSKHGNTCHDCPLYAPEKGCGVKSSTPEEWLLEKREVWF